MDFSRRDAVILLFFIANFHCAHGRIGFKKDVGMDLVFPPKLKERSEGIPQGHLRPLGWQTRPEAKLPEIKQFPTPQEFETKFINPERPVVMRGVMKEVPAMTNWARDDYLKANYAKLDVHVTVKKELLKKGPEKMKFKKFLKEYQYEDWYLSNIIPNEMMSELVLPKPLLCGAANRAMLESEIWMSSGGTSSLLHAHADHDLHCVLAGRKDFILIEAKHKDNLQWIDKVIEPGAGYSLIDVDLVNMFKSQGLLDTPWTWSTLYAGDCIYIPAAYLHQVRSYGRSFSSTILWAPSHESDFSDCKDVDVNVQKSLNEATFLWSYTHGDRHVTDEDMTGESLRRHLVILMRKEEHLRLAVFRDFYNEIMSEIDDYPEVEEVWKLMDPELNNKIHRENLTKISTDILNQVAQTLNKAHEGHRKPKITRDEL